MLDNFVLADAHIGIVQDIEDLVTFKFQGPGVYLCDDEILIVQPEGKEMFKVSIYAKEKQNREYVFIPLP